MEQSNPYNEDSDRFYDASEEFPLSDCTNTSQSELSTSDSSLSHLQPSKHESTDSIKLQHSPEYSSSSNLRRRRSSVHKKNRDPDVSTVSNVPTNAGDESLFSRARSYRKHRNLRDREREFENSESTQSQISSIRNEPVDVSITEREETPESDVLVYLAELVIKAIGFQMNFLISMFTFPLWSLHSFYMFVVDPFGTVRRAGEYFTGIMLRLWGIVCVNVSPSVYEWLKEHKSVWKMVLPFGWGFLWAGYVCFVMCSLLVSSFVISGFVIRHVVEEPIQMKETLNFDYTKNSPVAFVPIISCPYGTSGMNYLEKFEPGKSAGLRVIPSNHKLQVSVSMTLPESEYNQRLGIFQVRVDFLSTNGDRIGSLHNVCMLQYKSLPIRLLLTFFKVAPLVTGYLSESQTLNVKMRGFTERSVPTSCLKVMIEHRAEFRPGAGIPEIYTAALLLESELPLIKKVIWYWKKTLFVWIAIMTFMMELLFSLLCCRPIIMPRVRTRTASTWNNTQNNEPRSS